MSGENKGPETIKKGSARDLQNQLSKRLDDRKTTGAVISDGKWVFADNGVSFHSRSDGIISGDLTKPLDPNRDQFFEIKHADVTVTANGDHCITQ